MLNFAIIEDDKKVLNDICHFLESIFMQQDYEAEIGLHTSSVDELLSYIETTRVDVLILDINLKSRLTGIQIAELVRKNNKDCYIIFVTAHLEYCLVAYKYKTFDFIPKPINSHRLKECVTRLFDDVASTGKKFIRLDNKNTIIAQDEIKYIKKDGMKLIFHTDSRDYEIYSSFTKIKDKLPNNFVRCHKSFIANIDNITKVEPTGNTIFFDTSSCEIGPKYKNNFLEVINEYGNVE